MTYRRTSQKTVTVGGAGLVLTTTVLGQNAKPTFVNTVNTVTLTLLKPDGTLCGRPNWSLKRVGDCILSSCVASPPVIGLIRQILSRSKQKGIGEES